MRLKQEKCTFWVKADKFLSFYLRKRGIEENPNKYEEFIWMEELKKEGIHEGEQNANNFKHVCFKISVARHSLLQAIEERSAFPMKLRVLTSVHILKYGHINSTSIVLICSLRFFIPVSSRI